MSLGLKRRVNSLLRLACASAVVVGFCAAAIAGVTSSTSQRQFVVEGTTATALVRFMNGHALDGDHGHAYANIHPHYDLSLATRAQGGICRPSRVDVHVSFDLTLPVADSPGAMSRRTHAAWSNFVAFARAHEAHHKASYLGCAGAFVAQAMRQSAPSCFSLESDIRQMLTQMERACEAKQMPFDRSQARLLTRLRLFSMARYRSQ